MKYLTVHHSGDNTSAEGIDRYQVWQNWHMDGRGWGDVAYHYIIGRTGVVYRARDIKYRGDTGTNYDPNRHFLVVLEGNFEKVSPTDAQLDRLPVVLAWAAQQFGIATDSIAGHRDYASTKCPGRSLQPVISSGTLKSQVDTILATGGVRLG